METKRQLMSFVTVLALALGNLAPVSAWFFAPPKNVARANGKPVDSLCEALGEQGDCGFYQCFEERLQCGAEGYMQRFGQPYCRRFQTTLSAFDKEGQEFVHNAGQCLTQALLPYYRQDEVDCHRLSHAAFDAVSSCYAAHGFCQVVKSNAGPLVDIYQPKHLFQTGALKIWREILEITYHCDPEQVQSLASKAFNFLSGVLRFFTSNDDA